MGSSFRGAIKRLAPTSLKKAVWSVRDAVAAPPIDDSVLADYAFQPEPGDRVRLNLTIPNVTRRQLFGGVKTGLDIFFAAASAIEKKAGCDIRVIITDPTRETDGSIIEEAIARSAAGASAFEIVQIPPLKASLPVRRNDLFVAFNWWCALNIRSVIEAQADHFTAPIKPLVYLIQEYEPHLREFSSAHILAREALDRQQRLWGIFNSANLQSYFKRQGHVAQREWVFEPIIHEKLRPALARVAASKREKRILVYGRPEVERNCFPALLRGLRHWARSAPDAADWELVSAGSEHKQFTLGNGVALRSVGKLSIDEYAEMLLSSSVGISLMASPHPSYPPLEMAHFGLRTITNTFADKDLVDYHPNVVSIGSITEAELSRTIDRCCRAFGEPVAMAENPDFVRDEAFGFIDELAQALLDEISPAT